MSQAWGHGGREEGGGLYTFYQSSAKFLTSNEGLLWHSSDDELDDVSTVLDNGDGIWMKHTLRAIAIDLKKLIANLGGKMINE